MLHRELYSVLTLSRYAFMIKGFFAFTYTQNYKKDGNVFYIVIFLKIKL